jgi:hypothetical protein
MTTAQVIHMIPEKALWSSILQQDVKKYTELEMAKLEASALLMIEDSDPNKRFMGFAMLGMYQFELKRRWF